MEGNTPKKAKVAAKRRRRVVTPADIRRFHARAGAASLVNGRGN